MSQINRLCKYVDDTTLILPHKADVSAKDEFDYVLQQSFQNKLVINFSKTKDVTFRRPDLRRCEKHIVINSKKCPNTFKLLESSSILYFVRGCCVPSRVNVYFWLVN